MRHIPFVTRAICRLIGPAILFEAALLAAPCESMPQLQLADTKITSAQVVGAGEFVQPSGPVSPVAAAEYKKLPAFCRVEGLISPTPDSKIEFEVWMPMSGWNGRYLGVGNGGLAGSINYTAGPVSNAPGMAQALAGGYATSSTDTGHKASALSADWAVGHPEKVIDYGYRAVHLTAVDAKKIIGVFYDASGNEALKSYFSSCSNGGRQALMEAQRYPSDYIGIIAGDPAWYATHLAAAQIWNTQAILSKPESYIPAKKLPAIEAAVLEKCDALDGVKDGVIDDPRKCHFDPAALLCKGAESDTCLTRPQVEAMKKIYAGPASSTGTQIFPGLFGGAETGPGGWGSWIIGSEPGKSNIYAFGVGALAKMVYQPGWDYRSFNFDRDVAVLDDKLGPVRNATDPDLGKFKDQGGKLILYHGWNDPDISPLSTTNYYENVAGKMGQKSAEEFLRVYLVPGMQHCGGGPGATVFGGNLQLALERWVEGGTAPAEVIATKLKTATKPEDGAARTRPICPYPQTARYKGAGSTDDAANFACVTEH